MILKERKKEKKIQAYLCGMHIISSARTYTNRTHEPSHMHLTITHVFSFIHMLWFYSLYRCFRLLIFLPFHSFILSSYLVSIAKADDNSASTSSLSCCCFFYSSLQNWQVNFYLSLNDAAEKETKTRIKNKIEKTSIQIYKLDV